MRFTYLILLSLVGLFACTENQIKIHKEERITSNPLFFTTPNLPKEMFFCNDRISLEDQDVRERLDREVLLSAYYHSQTIGIFKRANRYFPLIENIIMNTIIIPNNIPKTFFVIEKSMISSPFTL